MRVIVNNRILQLLQGDITSQSVDAIVNAANSRLAGGGGVDGAIHRAGGPSIMDETRRLYPAGCPTGSAVISAAGQLSARHVIHAVGPVYSDGTRGEPELLASAYRTCLDLAAAHDCRSIAFPSLSTGAYRYPLTAASRIALATTIEFLREHTSPDCVRFDCVRFVLFTADILQEFEAALKELVDDSSTGTVLC